MSRTERYVDPLDMPQRLAADIEATVRPPWRRRVRALVVALLLLGLVAVASVTLTGCGGCGTYPAQVIESPTSFDGGTPRILVRDYGLGTTGCEWWIYFGSWIDAEHHYPGEILYGPPGGGGGGGGSW